MSDQLHTPAALILGKDASSHWIEGWVGLRHDMDVMMTKNPISAPAGHQTLFIQSIA